MEDDREQLKLLRENLKGPEFRASFAASGAEALKLAATGEIELLLTDVLLPDISGIVLARTLLAKQPQARVVFMSGYLRPSLHDPDNTDNLLTPPPPFIQKPFSGKSLRAFLRKVREDALLQATEPERST